MVLYDYSDYVSGGEMFTHLYQRERFSEPHVKIYVAEIVLAIETLHKVGDVHDTHEYQFYNSLIVVL
jgi:serine/threonine protein kinase